jgi:1L-myo-inositol 1-phosphate cytidylyltransferase / CDP-L-myo-inositol myo-inositolphosphotransferase
VLRFQTVVAEDGVVLPRRPRPIILGPAADGGREIQVSEAGFDRPTAAHDRPRDTHESVAFGQAGAAAPVSAPPRVAVVLAAGRAERLSKITRGRPKALVLLGGLPLVERAIRTLLAAGVERVIVVSGYQGESLREATTNIPTEKIRIIRSQSWEAGNGASLAAAQGAVFGEERFVLLCGDTVFSRGALGSLVQSSAPAVLVDPSPSPSVWDEGSKVEIEDGMAIRFGKGLRDPAIDCGAFVLGPEVFEAQRRAAASGDHSLAGAITELSRNRPLHVVALPADAWWQDIDTPDDLREARTMLRRSLASPTDGPISRSLNRPISTRLTMAISPFRLSPTLLTFAAFLVGIYAAWSLSAGRAVVGGLMAQLNSVLDGIDGETARLHYRASRSGARLDATADRMIDAAVIAGVGLWLWVDPSRTFRASIILAGAAGWGIIAYHLQDKVSTFELPPSAERPISLMLLGRDVRMFILAVGSLLALPLAGLAAGFLTYCSSGLLRVVRVLRLGWIPFRARAEARDLRRRAA